MTTDRPPRRLHPATLRLLQAHRQKARLQSAAPPVALPPSHPKPVPAKFTQTALPLPVEPLECLVIDTETTGLIGARLVEIAALHVRDGVVLRQFQTLVDPGIPIPARATQVHGITDAMVTNAPSVRVAVQHFLAFAGKLPLVAHNAGFDRRVLTDALQSEGLPSPGLPVYCTLRLARKTIPGAPSYRLDSLASFLKLSSTPAHRAMADARTALGLLQACLERHPGAPLATLHGPAKTL